MWHFQCLICTSSLFLWQLDLVSNQHFKSGLPLMFLGIVFIVKLWSSQEPVTVTLQTITIQYECAKKEEKRAVYLVKRPSFPIILKCFYLWYPSTAAYNHHPCFKEGDLVMMLPSLKGKDNKVTEENQNQSRKCVPCVLFCSMKSLSFIIFILHKW